MLGDGFRTLAWGTGIALFFVVAVFGPGGFQDLRNKLKLGSSERNIRKTRRFRFRP